MKSPFKSYPYIYEGHEYATESHVAMYERCMWLGMRLDGNRVELNVNLT